MSIISKIKFIYENWSSLEKLKVSSDVNLDGYNEYKLVNNIFSTRETLESRGWEIHEGVGIPSEIVDKAESFKIRVLEGRL